VDDEITANRKARRAATRARQLRQRRLAAAVATAFVLVVVLVVALAGTGGAGGRGRAAAARSAKLKAQARASGDLTYSSGGQLAAPVQDAAAAVLPDGRIVLLGGIGASGQSTSQVTIVTGGHRVAGGALPAPQHDAAAATLAGAVYVFGGGVQSSYDHILRYDPASQRTTVVGKLPRASSDVAVATIGDTAYIVGGYDGVTASPDIVAWKPGGPARVVGRLPTGLRYAGVAESGGRLVIAGGSVGQGPSNAIYSFDPATKAVRLIGRLPAARTHAAAATLDGRVYLIGGYGATTASATDEILEIDPLSGRVRYAGTLPQPLSDLAAVTPPGGSIVFAGGSDGVAAQTEVGLLRPAPPLPAPSAALPGDILIADRGNNRILLVNTRKQVIWRFPTAADLALGRRLRYDDDVFVAPGGAQIVANEEDSHVIVEVDVATHALKVLYGHLDSPGSGPGYLDTPDDAYPLAGGVVSVADAYNCRILYIRAHRIIRQLGRTGACYHSPPQAFGDVNGDTPTPGGGVLISEVNNSWIDAIDAHGHLTFSFRAPVSYPSDPQPLSGGRILLADYTNPGQIVIVDQRGHVLWRYGPHSGPGRLDHPSLAAMLPNGNIAVNDDYRDRIVVLDPRQGRIVWQYGHTGQSGTGAGQLKIPDGLDFVPQTLSGQPNWAATQQPIFNAPVLVR